MKARKQYKAPFIKMLPLDYMSELCRGSFHFSLNKTTYDKPTRTAVFVNVGNIEDDEDVEAD